MSPFEYVSVLISIVLGLGITQIVTGVADLIQHNSRTKIFWPHLLWAFLVFFLHLQEWWLLFDLRHDTVWRLPVFLFTLLYPINLFILARLLFPSDWSLVAIDLRAYYFANYRKFFFLICLLSVLSIIDNTFILQRALMDSLVPILLLILLLSLIRLNYQQEWVHQLVVVLLFVVMVGSFIWNWNVWVLTH
ncbi:MAG: hypothetical protein ACOYXA_03435 [Bacteroidota bacterium]